MTIDLKHINESEELRDLNSTLSRVESIIRNYINNTQSKTVMMNNARKIDVKIQELFKLQTIEECGNGTVWNPITEQCEAPDQAIYTGNLA